MADESKPNESRVVPLEYAGKWIAWSKDGTRIVASGQTFQDAVDAAAEAGETDPVLGKAPKADVRFVGVHR